MIKRHLSILFFVSIIYSSNIFSQNHRSEVIQKKTFIELKDNSIIYYDTILIQINERMGDNDARDRIIYQSGDKVSFGDIKIEDLKGNIIKKLKKNEVRERSYINDFSLFQDLSEKYFETRHHQYPYRIRYTKKKESKKYIDIITLDYSDSNIPIQDGIVIVEHDINKRIKQKTKNIDLYKTDTTENRILHSWKYSYKPIPTKQIFSSVNSVSAPIIIVSPIEFKYGIDGINQNWETFGQWDYNLNKDRDKLPIEEQNKINDLTAGIDGKYIKIRTLYQYLQDNTRYVNVSTKIGGHQSHTAEYVAKNKYGDCKALTNYMQSMLKHVGIESFYTIIYSDDKVYDLDNDFSYNAFNHVILCVPIHQDTIFLECTSKDTPMGYIHTSNQGRKALLVKEQGSKLINIPKMHPKDVLCEREVYIKLTDNGEAEINLKAIERGKDYQISNAYNENASRNTIDHFIRYSILEGSYEILDYSISKENRDSAYINIEVNNNMKDVYKLYGKNLVISSFPIYIPQFEDPIRRTQDVQIDFPIYKKDKLIINTQDFNISNVPQNIEVVSPFGDFYKVNYSIVDNNIIVEKEFLIKDKRFEIDRYKEFYNFIIQVKNNEISNLYLEIL